MDLAIDGDADDFVYADCGGGGVCTSFAPFPLRFELAKVHHPLSQLEHKASLCGCVKCNGELL